MKPTLQLKQTGASLIEVLVAILILSFGMLSLGAMMSYAVQLPKLSGYRATAANLASSHIERIRANPNAFASDLYSAALNETSGWSFADLALADCQYADPCTESTLATMDIAATRRAVRRELPGGDMIMKCDAVTCSQASYGNLWIVWQEPSTFAALNSSNSDNCPTEATTVYAAPAPAPRCLYVRFKIE
jgi:type IV pilus assembly protein PilV